MQNAVTNDQMIRDQGDAHLAHIVAKLVDHFPTVAPANCAVAGHVVVSVDWPNGDEQDSCYCLMGTGAEEPPAATERPGELEASDHGGHGGC